MKNKISEAASAMGSARTEKKATAARENGAKGGRPKIHLEVGDTLNVALRSTGRTSLEITHAGFTAEVNGEDINEHGIVQNKFGGIPVNDSERVPACIGVNTYGIPHAIYLWRGKWRGASHRIFKFSREWENKDGTSLPPDLSKMVDDILFKDFHGR